MYLLPPCFKVLFELCNGRFAHVFAHFAVVASSKGRKRWFFAAVL